MTAALLSRIRDRDSSPPAATSDYDNAGEQGEDVPPGVTELERYLLAQNAAALKSAIERGEDVRIALSKLGVVGDDPDGGVLGRLKVVEDRTEEVRDVLVKHKAETAAVLKEIRDELRLSTTMRRVVIAGFLTLIVRLSIGMFQDGLAMGWW